MTQVEHTPGPWKVLDYADKNKGFIAVVTEARNPAEHVADVFPFGNRPGGDKRPIAEHLANARLIAAAPLMRDALKKARAAIAVYVDGEGGNDGDVVAEAVEAISEALSVIDGRT